jgi:hypothetical protein
MSIEVEVLSEVYTTMKQYISQKDRQEVADNLMSVMVDVLNDLDLKEFASTDAALSRAYKEYSSEYDEDEDYTDYEN